MWRTSGLFSLVALTSCLAACALPVEDLDGSHRERLDAQHRSPIGEKFAVVPMPDLTLGPYPSALEILLKSIRVNASTHDTRASYAQSTAQGYQLQAIATLLAAAAPYALPGGETARDELVAIAVGEVEELMGAAHRTLDGGPAFGLDSAWDAFGDGSTNPAFTAYAWQSGMVALGIAELLHYLHHSGDRHLTRAGDVARMRAFLDDMLCVWDARYTSFVEGGERLGYFWYSTSLADAKAVHNTSANLAIATQLFEDIGGTPCTTGRAREVAALLRRRLINTTGGGYRWNYVDDGYPANRRSSEDISHALSTLRLMRFARDRGWWSDAHMAAVAVTLTRQIWNGHPARLNGRVDGSTLGADDWSYSRGAPVGLAVHGDAPGGNPLVFELARSALVSSYMTRFGRPLSGAVVDPVRALAIATLLAHRPAGLPGGTMWSVVAGPGDDAPPTGPGVRFYVADWAPPAAVRDDAGLSLVARTATAPSENILIDVEPAERRPVMVSITYRATADGQIEQWDGSAYRAIAPLPASRSDDNRVYWMRTSFVLDPSRYFDYEGHAGKNLLLQITQRVDLHRIEATPMSR